MIIPLIGLWWYTRDRELWTRSTLKDLGVIHRNHVVYRKDLDYVTLWKELVEEHEDNPEELIRSGYETFEHGTVEYNFLTQRYEIICSGVIYDNTEFRRSVMKAFNLIHARIEFVLRVD